jgi:hypothetical protein
MAEKKSVHTGDSHSLPVRFAPGYPPRPYRVMPHSWHPAPDADYIVNVWGREGAAYEVAPAGFHDAAERGLHIEGPWDSIRVYFHSER